MTRYEVPLVTISHCASMSGDADGGHTVVWVRGEHDVSTKAALTAAIGRAAQRDDSDLLVDLSAVTFMDASTVGAIVSSRNRLRSTARSLEVRAPSASALRVLELCGLTHLIQPGRVEAEDPTGVAPALNTWVDVPATGASREAGGDAGWAAPSEELHTADARSSRAGATVEVDRGGP